VIERYQTIAAESSDDRLVWVDGQGVERPASAEGRRFETPRLLQASMTLEVQKSASSSAHAKAFAFYVAKKGTPLEELSLPAK